MANPGHGTHPTPYCGRFAPSPTGPLHLGSLVAALASWLDARAHQGRWLVRIEDIDPPREQAGAAQQQLVQLAALGLTADEAPSYQSAHAPRYMEALSRLQAGGHLYACTCSRSAAEAQAQRHGLPPGVYPGTCRGVRPSALPAAVRVQVAADPVHFIDRACGPYRQQLERDVGDFVLRRADGLWAYQLAVVVDDGAQGVTDVVRGADLLDNTPRQIYLQRLLRLPTPRYLHVAVVVNDAGEKLSKQTGAAPLDVSEPLRLLEQAWRHLGFPPTRTHTVPEFLAHAVSAWSARWGPGAARADTIGAAGSHN